MSHKADKWSPVPDYYLAPSNAAPARENLEFIRQCQASLPDEYFIQALRIDAACYQAKIIEYCDDNDIHYAIRAKMCNMYKEQIDSLTEADWQPLLNKKGKPIKPDQPLKTHTYRTVHCISDYAKPSFNHSALIIQRTRIQGQVELD